jgi:hypothetical protein
VGEGRAQHPVVTSPRPGPGPSSTEGASMSLTPVFVFLAIGLAAVVGLATFALRRERSR